MTPARPHVLVAGVSTRAAADSAARAGFEVTAIDAFGDLDQHTGVRCLSLPRDCGAPFSAREAAQVARGLSCDAVAYASSFENHPAAVRALQQHTLWGNAPEVLRRVRDPFLLTKTLGRRGFAVPDVSREVPRPEGSKRWLLKPRCSGGGRHVRPFSIGRDADLPRGWYLQEHIDGVPGSVVFAAANGRAVPLGLSRQLIGGSEFGASGFQYCGNILASSDDPHFERGGELVDAACALACAVSEEFDLVGVNGIDFIAREGVPYPIEVNPRWTASMELVERAFDVSMFAIHAAACEGGTLPDFDLRSALRVVQSAGKAVVFAREDVIAGDTRSWLADTTVRDVPQPEERIAAGSPVCTVFANGADASECHALLVGRAGHVYAELTRQLVAPSFSPVGPLVAPSFSPVGRLVAPSFSSVPRRS